MTDEPVTIVPYDERWPERFARERDALAAAIGSWAGGGIHHVGSTAVPDLAAKPVIDILVGVDEFPAPEPCLSAIASLGYLYAPYRAAEMHWFCKPSPEHRTHHLHVTARDSPRFAAELAFRDALRADPALAGEYAALKRELAARFRDDREAYTAAKAEFIHGVATAGDRA